MGQRLATNLVAELRFELRESALRTTTLLSLYFLYGKPRIIKPRKSPRLPAPGLGVCSGLTDVTLWSTLASPAPFLTRRWTDTQEEHKEPPSPSSLT